MDMQGNTILITGGSLGIGRGLAEAFHSLWNRVIVAGRRQLALKQVTDANPGMQSVPLDLESGDTIHDFARHIKAKYPNLNVPINNGGIQRPENLLEQPDDLAAMNGSECQPARPDSSHGGTVAAPAQPSATVRVARRLVGLGACLVQAAVRWLRRVVCMNSRRIRCWKTQPPMSLTFVLDFPGGGAFKQLLYATGLRNNHW